MKTIQHTPHLFFMALLTLIITGCGTEGTTPTTLPNTTLNFDFRVTSSSPVNASFGINASSSNVQMFFSENVDPTTIETNISVRKDTGGSSQTLPSSQINMDPVGNMVDIEILDQVDNSGSTSTYVAGLQENTIYYVVLLPGLKSSNNNQLYDGQYPQGVQISFSTGVGYGNSLPGPPKVQSIEKFNNFNGCFTAMVRFTEDVSLYFNDITLSSTAFLSLGNSGLVNTSIYPYYTGRQDV
ncbi:MAG: Ig-like domain-containing protein, partial [Deltaproteobacteria bacterium]|nr:Ig-like domain-containing protein [Deltaproteobacteria bacterium]